MDDHERVHALARGGHAAPLAALRAGHPGDLDDALRTDDDVLQVEVDVGKGAEEAGVEAAGAGVAFPALARGDDLVNAVFGERGNEAGEVAAVFGLGVVDPEAADRLVFGGVWLKIEAL